MLGKFLCSLWLAGMVFGYGSLALRWWYRRKITRVRAARLYGVAQVLPGPRVHWVPGDVHGRYVEAEHERLDRELREDLTRLAGRQVSEEEVTKGLAELWREIRAA